MIILISINLFILTQLIIFKLKKFFYVEKNYIAVKKIFSCVDLKKLIFMFSK